MNIIDIYYLFGLIFSFVFDEENKMIIYVFFVNRIYLMLIYLFIDELYLCEFCIVFLFLNFNLFDIYLLFVIFVEIKFIF